MGWEGEGGKESASPFPTCASISMNVQHSCPRKIDGVASSKPQPRWVGLTSNRFTLMEICGSLLIMTLALGSRLKQGHGKVLAKSVT